jgi:hypothetical protein
MMHLSLLGFQPRNPPRKASTATICISLEDLFAFIESLQGLKATEEEPSIYFSLAEATFDI